MKRFCPKCREEKLFTRLDPCDSKRFDNNDMCQCMDCGYYERYGKLKESEE